MKMVEMLTAVMAKVILNKEQKKYDEALTEIENAGKNIIGLDIGMVKILKIDDFTGLMKTSDVFAGRCLISAELLLEYAKILEEKGTDTDLKYDFYNKSFRLYTEALLTKEILEPTEYIEKAESILPTTSSFVGRSAFILAGALSLVGFFLMIASSVASLPCEMLFAFTALACRPSNCFLLRPPRLQYCWYRLFTNSDPGWVCTISFNMSKRISILVVVKIANL